MVNLMDILDGIGEAVIVTNQSGDIQLVNKMAEKLISRSKGELLGRSIMEIMCLPDGWECLERLFEALEEGETIIWPDKKVTFISGGEKVVSLQFSPLLANGSSFCGMVITVRDITEQSQTMAQLRLDSMFLEILLNNIPDTIYFKDTQGRFTRINQAQADMLGLDSPEEGIGKTDFDFFTPEHARAAWEDEQQIIRTGQSLLDKTELVRRADGEFRWVSASKVPIRDENGNITGIVGISRDITERKRVEEKLKYLNSYDKLTGLYNRAYFEEQLRRLDSEQVLPLSIVVGDLNGLKIINDAFGHDAGDALLQEVASILKSCCRKEDIVARWGGDEFVILLPKSDYSGAEAVCERIRNRLQQYNWKYMRPSISLGIATKTQPHEDVKLLVKQADQAMYRDKLMGNRANRRMLMANLKKAMAEHSVNEKNLGILLALLARMVSIVDTYVDIASEKDDQAIAQKALAELTRCLHYEYDAGVMQQILSGTP